MVGCVAARDLKGLDCPWLDGAFDLALRLAVGLAKALGDVLVWPNVLVGQHQRLVIPLQAFVVVCQELELHGEVVVGDA